MWNRACVFECVWLVAASPRQANYRALCARSAAPAAPRPPRPPRRARSAAPAAPRPQRRARRARSASLPSKLTATAQPHVREPLKNLTTSKWVPAAPRPQRRARRATPAAPRPHGRPRAAPRPQRRARRARSASLPSKLTATAQPHVREHLKNPTTSKWVPAAPRPQRRARRAAPAAPRPQRRPHSAAPAAPRPPRPQRIASKQTYTATAQPHVREHLKNFTTSKWVPKLTPKGSSKWVPKMTPKSVDNER